MSGSLAAERWGLTGHDEAVNQLATSIASGRVAHAYLITGPEGVGRTSLALALTRALNCDAAPEQRPCNACASCTRMARRAHPDITLVDLAWQEQMISRERASSARARQRLSIDAVKWLRADIVSRPLQGRWKIQIIDDAELLTDDAFNAYLKTLEEPPPFAVIVLIARSEDSVPETIRSRCQRIALGSVPTDSIRTELLVRGIDERVADQVARAARGRIAWAVDITSDPARLGKRREKLEAALEQMVTPLGRVAISGVMARDFSKRRDATLVAVEFWTGLWRDALLYRTGLAEQIAFPEVGDRLQDYAGQWNVHELYRALWATRRCATDLDANVQPRIALQAMVLQWPE
jgi:DNA polymerase III subunit delta'